MTRGSNIKQKIINCLPYGVVNCMKKSSDDSIKMLFPNDVPCVYDENGNKMNIWYLQDRYYAHTPYSISYGRNAEIFLWDRYNYALPYHLYTGRDCLENKGTPIKKYCWLPEAKAIVPEDYSLFYNYNGLANEFKYIFTYDENILQDYSNARFAPASTVWVGTTLGGGVVDKNLFSQKNKNVSMIASNKIGTENQRFRVSLAKHLKNTGKVNTFGQFDGGNYLKFISDAFLDYRYSVVIENECEAYSFTEKIFNCFATMTVPIYFGATKIREFFNEDGIIFINSKDADEVERIIQGCSIEDYISRKNAMIDNFERVQKYISMEKYLWEEYLQYEI